MALLHENRKLECQFTTRALAAGAPEQVMLSTDNVFYGDQRSVTLRAEIRDEDFHAFHPCACDLVQIRFHQAFGGTRNDVAADKFACLLGSARAGFHSSPNAADVAGDDSGHESSADADAFDDLYVCGLRHGVSRFNEAEQAFGFYHSNCSVHVRMALGVRNWE